MAALLDKIFAKLDLGMVSDFGKALWTLVTLVGIVLLIMLILFIVKWIIFKVYCKCSNPDIQEKVTTIIYHLDSLADQMSKKEKRNEAINTVKDLFIWRSIPIPKFVIGVIIDLEVKAIRTLQKDAADEKDPYLCPDISCEDEELLKTEKEDSECEQEKLVDK